LCLHVIYIVKHHCFYLLSWGCQIKSGILTIQLKVFIHYIAFPGLLTVSVCVGLTFRIYFFTFPVWIYHNHESISECFPINCNNLSILRLHDLKKKCVQKRGNFQLPLEITCPRYTEKHTANISKYSQLTSVHHNQTAFLKQKNPKENSVILGRTCNILI